MVLSHSASRQDLLPLTFAPLKADPVFFVDACNQEAWSHLSSWPAWSLNALIVAGPRGCGKTYMGKLWQRRTKAYRWPLEADAVALFEKKTKPHLLVDNLADWVRPDDQAKKLLAALNAVRERGGTCLLLGEPPFFFDETLKDLTSRLKAMVMTSLQVPNDALFRRVLELLFDQMQCAIKNDVLCFLCHRIPREMGMAQKVVRFLNQESLKQKKKVTLDFVRAYSF